jgi:hypothetical protein
VQEKIRSIKYGMIKITKVSYADNFTYTVPKTMQISESIGVEVPWRGNFPVNLGN